jgi:hypothetical protein
MQPCSATTAAQQQLPQLQQLQLHLLQPLMVGLRRLLLLPIASIVIRSCQWWW